MMNEQRQEELSLIETHPVEDKYVDGLGYLEVTGPNLRFVFYATRTKGGAYDHEVAERVVMPMEGIAPLLKAIVTTPRILEMLDAEQLRKVVTALGMMH